MTSPNLEQKRAIETIDSNVIVNAGAGTGKTKVLTERYIHILENGKFYGDNPIESIVAITFTNKATQEMIERIRQQIKAKVSEDGAWMEHYRDMEKANISTIHGFCAKILRENPIEANINPYFEIFDEGVSNQYLNISIMNILNRYLDKDERLIKAMLLFNFDQLELLVEALKSIYTDIRTLGVDFQEMKMKLDSYIQGLEVKTENIEEIKKSTEDLMDSFGGNTNLVKFRQDEMWIKFKNDDYNSEDIFDYLEAILENLGNSKKEIETQNKLKKMAAEILEAKEVQYRWLYELVLDLVAEIDKEYEGIKRRAGGLDYDDLQIKVLNLLDEREILRKYQKKYKYFMIDEFQDTNELQKNIFYKLTSVESTLDRENLFVVGDPKQSIYGFRGADVAVFYDVLEDIKSKSKKNVITLGVNYRSLDVVMDFVNSIFGKFMGNLYDPLNAFNKNKKEDLKIEIIENEELEPIDGISDSEGASLYEADMIAKRIKQLYDSGDIDYGDVALLFRATTRTYIYEQALKKYKIPYYNNSSKRFYEKQEIKDIIIALKALGNSHDLISHIGFLKSPMIGLNDESIYRIFKNKKDNLFGNLEAINQEDFEESERLKIEEAISLYKHFYHIKDSYSVDQLVEQIIEKTHYIESLLFNDDGEQMAANVSKFIDIAGAYYSEELGSLEDFIDYLEDVRLLTESEETIQMENANVVKLMTIHGSKGLEFPVVFLPELSRRSINNNPLFIYDKEDGLAVKNGIISGKYDKLKDKLKDKDKEEDKRVLYVAMTRAEKLLVLGFQGRNSGIKKEIYEMVKEEDVRFLEEINLDFQKKNNLEILEVDEIKSHISKASANPELIYDMDGYDLVNINNYSISQYMEFRECKRNYFLNHIWKIDLPKLVKNKIELEGLEDYKSSESRIFSELKGSIRGNIVHDFANNYRLGMDVENLMEDSILNYNIEPSQDIYKELKPYIDNYLKNYKEDYEEIYSEKPFYLKMDRGYISGIIDRINIYYDSLEIIDFKTNRVNGNLQKHIDYYSPQLSLYAYAMKEIMDLRVNSSSILFLDSGDMVDIDISDSSLEKNLEAINCFVEYINKYQEIEAYEKTESCNKYCKYKEFCSKF